MNQYFRIIIVSILIFLNGCTKNTTTICSNEDGFLITNVSVIDGTGANPKLANVRVSDNIILDIGDLDSCPNELIINGNELYLAPGFIDTHSHADSDIFERPDALPVISQGITTIIAGQDGRSPFPLAEFYEKLEKSPATVNIASYIGHGTLRLKVMGDDFQRTATNEEIEQMKVLLRKEMESGPLGFGTGLEYEPGIHSDTSEVIALAKIVADTGGRYISHIRSEDRWFEDAIDEIILIGKETGMPVQISHMKLAMKRLWGSAEDVIRKLNRARNEGINITADIYPYEYWQSTIMVLLPDRDPTNRETIAELLDQIAPAEGIWMTKFGPDPSYVGKTLAEIASIREVDTITAFSQIALEALEWEEENGESGESIIGTSMKESDISMLLSWPYANISSDGGIINRHPRSTGSYPRVLGRYVRQKNVLSLPEAIRKMTSLAATNMGITDRGQIKSGMIADLVLFDPKTVIDHSTPLEPGLISSGIHSVWVNGKLTYQDGTVTDARAGQIIRKN